MVDKPSCKLVGTDGNVFAIIGKVTRALKSAGQHDKSKEFMTRATSSGNYDEVLMLVHEYVEVE